jgi:hypothetical protein
VVGEQFQGRFALDDRITGDTARSESARAEWLQRLRIEQGLERLEDVALGDYGEIVLVQFPPPPAPSMRISYSYTAGSPFSGRSDFGVEQTGPGQCEFMQRIAWREQNRFTESMMKWIGLKLHNDVVYGQVREAAALLDVAWTELDPRPRDQAGGNLALATTWFGSPP